MKLVSFVRDGRPTFGCAEGDELLDFGPQLGPSTSLRDILPGGLPLWSVLASGVAAPDRVAFDREALLAPVPNARKFLSLGGNYAAHLAETERVGMQRSKGQVWFNKQVTAINAPYGVLDRPFVSEQLDYEGELGVIIGRDCRHMRAADAWDYVAGYVVINDVSVRDWQMRAPTHMLGKSFDTHAPFGPWIVTADEIPDPHRLDLTVTVNGDVRQKANTSDMIHFIPAMIEELTTAFTLQAGDVLSTGTPGGVGGLMQPPQWLRDGDVVSVEIEAIGRIENRVVDEPAR